MEQRSEEWFQARLGHVTASNFAKVMSKGETRNTYMRELAVERLTNVKADSYINSAMQHGIDTEDEARFRYEIETDSIVESVGFIKHPDLLWVGASPDGKTGNKGLEIKCPNSATHLEYIDANKLPSKYKWQVHGQIWVCGFESIDFVSYDNRFKNPKLQYWSINVKRDESIIDELSTGVAMFLAELETMVGKYAKD